MKDETAYTFGCILTVVLTILGVALFLMIAIGSD
jgi:hypothetical protein